MIVIFVVFSIFNIEGRSNAKFLKILYKDYLLESLKAIIKTTNILNKLNKKIQTKNCYKFECFLRF